MLTVHVSQLLMDVAPCFRACANGGRFFIFGTGNSGAASKAPLWFGEYILHASLFVTIHDVYAHVYCIVGHPQSPPPGWGQSEAYQCLLRCRVSLGYPKLAFWAPASCHCRHPGIPLVFPCGCFVAEGRGGGKSTCLALSSF